ncbi:MAG: enoyl-CoA hydratase/isomerase family protein [Sphingobacteriaceae bacterium]|nr:enoyl-CoA hydratase/isomerase family protein [Cytophagaceae bacterium]
MYETILSETADGICRLTLNRPQAYNALSRALLLELTAAVETAAAAPAVRVIVLTGAGEKAFSSGADLKEGFSGGGSLGAALRETYNPLIRAIRQAPKPVIARLNGVAAGAGFSIALACDLRVAADTAQVSQIFINIGLVPDAGSTFFLPRLVGTAKAFELASTGRMVPAAEALQLGLVDRVVPAAELDAAVHELAARYAQAPTAAIGLIKNLLNASASSTLDEQLNREAEHQDLAAQTRDAAEGVTAFLQKRPAKFEGR